MHDGRCDRLIVEMPPRHGKSELCSRYFPAWHLGNRPTSNVILTSATGDLAEDFSVAVRDLLVEYGPQFFDTTLRRDVMGRKKWQLEQGGGLRAAGVGTGIMGRGADLLIIDDYFKDHEEALSEARREHLWKWYMSTSSTRLSPKGAVVVVATRWHRDDLIGRLLKAQEAGGDQWRVISFAAIATEYDDLGRKPGEALFPQVWTLDAMTRRREAYYAAGYGWMWEALYQQRPAAMLDVEFSPEYFVGDDLFFDQWPDPADVVFKVITLDPSKGKSDRNDFSAYTLAALHRDGTIYVDADLARRDSMVVVADGLKLASAFGPVDAFGVEVNQMQELFADLLATQSRAAGLMLPLVDVHNNLPKPSRIRGLTAYLKRREFKFRRGSPGVSLLLEQLRTFPNGKHDDGPDSLAMALALLKILFAGLEQRGHAIDFDSAVKRLRVTA